LGIYNSDALSGASQSHKHMQLIPIIDIIQYIQSSSSGNSDNNILTFPIDDLLRYDLLNNKWSYYYPYANNILVHTSTTLTLSTTIYTLPQVCIFKLLYYLFINCVIFIMYILV
jgi:hypothetical protein